MLWFYSQMLGMGYGTGVQPAPTVYVERVVEFSRSVGRTVEISRSVNASVSVSRSVERAVAFDDV